MFRAVIIAVAAMLLIAAAPIPSKQAEIRPQQSQIHHANTKDDQAPSPVTLNLFPSQGPWQPQPNAQPYYYYHYPTQEPDKGADAFLGISSGMWVAVFTFLLVAATFVQACLILRAENLTRKALRISQRQLGRNKLDTRNMLEQSERHARQELRAYLGVVSGSASITYSEEFDGLDRTIKAFVLKTNIEIKNAGKTPAHRVRIAADIQRAKTFSPAWLNDLTFYTQSGSVMPGAGFNTKPKKDVQKLVPAKKGDPTQFVFVFGRIEYSDAFDRPQWTNFRLTVGGDVETGNGDLRPCDEGNDAS